MLINKPFILKVIKLRQEQNDHPTEFATRNKASPLNIWSKFIPFTKEAFQKVFSNKFDGLKLRFKYVIVHFNGRHKSE